MSLDVPYPFDPDKPARHQAKLEPAKSSAPVKYNDDEISTILNNVYRSAYGEETDFQSPNKAFLDKPADWHFSDIEKEIDKLGDATNEYDRDGLKAVAYLVVLVGCVSLCKAKASTIQKISLARLYRITTISL